MEEQSNLEKSIIKPAGIYLATQDEITGETLVLYRGELPIINNIRTSDAPLAQQRGIKKGVIKGFNYIMTETKPLGKLHNILNIPAENIIRKKFPAEGTIHSIFYFVDFPGRYSLKKNLELFIIDYASKQPFTHIN